MISDTPGALRVGLLTGGGDKPYALGLTSALSAEGIPLDVVGSDRLDCPEFHATPLVNFLNLRKDQNERATLASKAWRIAQYYTRLIQYAFQAEPAIFHILWNNKFELFDRTLLLGYYRLCGRRIVLTAHNVNIRKRDRSDTFLNRLTLRIQYRLVDHIFVHTDRMKVELVNDFGVQEDRVTVIPFGINNTIPQSTMNREDARRRLHLPAGARVLLFFGQIAPYKGLEYLTAALRELAPQDQLLHLVIAGKVKKGSAHYWNEIQRQIQEGGLADRVVARIEHVPDEEVEIYFKAADVLVVPYTDIFQSGLPFLAFSFGLPIVATDVGSLREDILEGQTGFICRPRDPQDLAEAIRRYYDSDLYQQQVQHQSRIQAYANERYSWAKVSRITRRIYTLLLGGGRAHKSPEIEPKGLS